ncbi:MAG: prevent-host-death protein [Oscillatoriaceae cyanobacterium Prado104]|jgi:PHD/YefM family antitoxin component YafN of YafNO toxin-antitoxin module|nr:prevent-host-death protein [Oscillatoriaceae cyanobacterium Prado104]
MQSYTLAEACNPQETVFNQAALEPVLLTNKSQPSYVIMSADTYKYLVDRLMELEDILLGKAAKSALNQSQMVGTETFLETLSRLAANGET